MKFLNNLTASKWTRRFWPFIFILGVWLIFSLPYFLNNKVPFPSNYQVNLFSPWSVYENFKGPIKNNAMPDIITQIYPWRHLSIEEWLTGNVPFWNPYSFSGTLQLANYQSAVFSPFNILFFILKFVDAWTILVLLQPLLAGIFMYLFIGSLGNFSKPARLISAISFMFCGFITVWMGYATLGYAILFLPLALYSTEKYLKDKQKRYLFLLTLTIPLSFFSGHFQTSLYFFSTVIAYVLFKAFVGKRGREGFSLLLYCFFGILLTMPQVIPSLEFYLQSTRNDLFLKIEEIPWSYLPTLISPDFYGNPVTRNDWFGHYAEWSSYSGILPLLFAVFIIIHRKIKRISFFLILLFVSFILSHGSPLSDLLINLHIPVVSTSAQSRIIVLFSFSLAVLSAFGFDQLLHDIKEHKKKSIIFLLIFSLFIFLVLWAIVIFKLFLDPTKIAIAKSNLVLPTLIFISSSITILLFYNFNKGKYIYLFSLILLLIVCFDMIRFSTKWQPYDPKDLVFAETPISKYLPNISTYFRVYGNYTAEDSVYYHLPSVDGYDPVYIKRYGEFIASLVNGKLSDSPRSVVKFPVDGKYTQQAVDLLGIKYIIHKVSDGHSSWAFPFWNYPDKYKQIYKDTYFEIYENKYVLPRAFLVGKYTVINDDQKILDTLFSNNFKLSNQVILENNPQIKFSNETLAWTDIYKYTPQQINIATSSNDNAILVLTDVYYPGWEAEIDGEKTLIYRSDFTFRSVVVPKGTHDVRFYYRPASFKIGLDFALFAIFGIIILEILNYNKKRLK